MGERPVVKGGKKEEMWQFIRGGSFLALKCRKFSNGCDYLFT